MTGVWMKRVATAAAIVAMAATAAWAEPPAQQPTGSVTGSVSDNSGAAVTGASVTVRNTATGVARQAFTNLQGVFTISPLEPGQYSVTVTRLGFTPRVIADVAVAAGAATQAASASMLSPHFIVTLLSVPRVPWSMSRSNARLVRPRHGGAEHLSARVAQTI